MEKDSDTPNWTEFLNSRRNNPARSHDFAYASSVALDAYHSLFDLIVLRFSLIPKVTTKQWLWHRRNPQLRCQTFHKQSQSSTSVTSSNPNSAMTQSSPSKSPPSASSGSPEASVESSSPHSKPSSRPWPCLLLSNPTLSDSPRQPTTTSSYAPWNPSTDSITVFCTRVFSFESVAWVCWSLGSRGVARNEYLGGGVVTKIY